MSKGEALMGRIEIVQLVHGWGTVPADGSNGLLVHTTLLSALQHRAEVNEGISPPYDYWLIDNQHVAEPSPSGRIIGLVAEVPIDGKKVLRMSRMSYEHLTHV